MTKTEQVLCQFLMDHEAVVTSALAAYAVDMRGLAGKLAVRSHDLARTFTEGAERAEKALAALETLGDMADDL